MVNIKCRIKLSVGKFTGQMDRFRSCLNRPAPFIDLVVVEFDRLHGWPSGKGRPPKPICRYFQRGSWIPVALARAILLLQIQRLLDPSRTPSIKINDTNALGLIAVAMTLRSVEFKSGSRAPTY